ncbi:MAG: T9SS type A sorting domain-containing protein [Chloroflexota bacterium]
MARRAILYLIFTMILLADSFCQEVVTGLKINPSLKALAKDIMPMTKGLEADTLPLPFFDDFSGTKILPDPARWDDNNVFVNNTYSDRQITQGIATFDAIDEKGQLYETSTPSGFMADKLTSKPINLAYPASSAIWLSFLYEAGGLSDAPEPADSLTLQFYSPADNKWYSVWRAQGNEKRGFNNVIIPVAHQRWLMKGFRFRFVNYASLSRNLNDPSMIGNCDIWNIDYLLIDVNRNATDTAYNDVAFRLPVRSLLKRYEAMPWKQFRQVYLQEMGSAIPVHYRNNDAIIRNVTRNFEITDVYKNMQVHSFSAGATNVQPGSDVDYNASLIYTFNTDNTDSALFRITCSLKTDEFDPKSNDTITYYQVFSNYFAYDDGSSEGGYGINGLGSRNAMLAYRFTSFMPDTLRAIAICFNDSYQDANRRAFDIMVWDDNNGNPGNVIYSREEVIVESGSMINGFYNYHIPEGVKVDGIFYVGWKQRSETFLNAGFDINTPHKGKQFFWLNGAWNQSQTEGSVMIRPVLGLPLLTGINDSPEKDQNQISLWPNPAHDQVRISIKERPYSSSAFISIIDLSGHELMKVPFNDFIDVSELQEGMYIVVTIVNGRRIGFNRLIKSK